MTEVRPNQRSANGGRERSPEGLHRRYFWLLACAWTAAVAGSLAWNLAQQAREVRSLTSHAAQALLEKDMLYREWSVLHGGVYVPSTAQTPSNPYLTNVLERDVLTPSGRWLRPAIC